MLQIDKMATIPFETPQLLTARRTPGFVDIPEIEEEAPAPCKDWDGSASLSQFDSMAAEGGSKPRKPASKRASAAGPGLLKRSKTMDGNILIVEPEGEPPQAFWMQRKIGNSSSGSIVRLAYKLQPNAHPDFKNAASTIWQIATDEQGVRPIVAIKIMHSSVLDQKPDSSVLHNPLDEISALHLIAKQNTSNEDAHIISSHLLASCTQYVYAVVPHYPDGTLLQFCQTAGNLEEPVARFFFRQILQGLKTLQAAGLCHRNLSLDSIQLNGDHADITRLEWCLRYNKSAPKDEDSALPVPGASHPQYVAPEYFGFTTGVWDGFAADLWAVGLMLYSMVVSSEALFTAPIPDDRIFFDLCSRGKVGEQAEKFGKRIGKEISLSDDLVDLLQKMLKSDPKERLSLTEITEHPWVKKEEVVRPGEWLKAQQAVVKRELPTQPNGMDVSIRENTNSKTTKWLDEQKSDGSESS